MEKDYEKLFFEAARKIHQKTTYKFSLLFVYGGGKLPVVSFYCESKPTICENARLGNTDDCEELLARMRGLCRVGKKGETEDEG